MIKNKLKVCLWTNRPTHHQKSFFRACFELPGVDFLVRYYAGRACSALRASQGWVSPELDSFEAEAVPADILKPEMRSCVHIIPALDPSGGRELAKNASEAGLKWMYWGERTGLHFAAKLHFNYRLFYAVYPFLNRIRLRQYAGYIRNSAMLALAQGKLAADDLISLGVKKSRIRFLSYSVPAVVASEPDEAISKFSAGRKVFLCVSGLLYMKGLSYLLEAYAMLEPELRSRSCLVFAGNGPYLAEMKQKAYSLGINDSVMFRGAVPSTEIGKVYSAGDVFVMPSLHDGWGAVLNEAASAGLPIISTEECGSAWHLIKDGFNGRRVKAKSSSALAAAMEEYLLKPDLVKEHGINSRKIFTEFTPERGAARLAQYLKEEGMLK
ncbi:MAG: glycosyltransferase family 4 protein [Elusimicrobiales bacterium]|nr:glycosyltransferase family 4 protein [Elusimicrobiales bacterium]